MRAGVMDRRIELQTQGAASEGDFTAGAWATQKTVYAEWGDRASGSESFQSDQDIALATNVFRIRYDATIDPTWRVKDDLDDLWDIVGAVEGKGRRTETILFVRRLDPNAT